MEISNMIFEIERVEGRGVRITIVPITSTNQTGPNLKAFNDWENKISNQDEYNSHEIFEERFGQILKHSKHADIFWDCCNQQCLYNQIESSCFISVNDVRSSKMHYFEDAIDREARNNDVHSSKIHHFGNALDREEARRKNDSHQCKRVENKGAGEQKRKKGCTFYRYFSKLFFSICGRKVPNYSKKKLTKLSSRHQTLTNYFETDEDTFGMKNPRSIFTVENE
jgi:hypothetical protein